MATFVGTDLTPVELLHERFYAMTRMLAVASGNDYLVYIFDRLSGDMARVWTIALVRELVMNAVGRWPSVTNAVITPMRGAQPITRLARSANPHGRERASASTRQRHDLIVVGN